MGCSFSLISLTNLARFLACSFIVTTLKFYRCRTSCFLCYLRNHLCRGHSRQIASEQENDSSLKQLVKVQSKMSILNRNVIIRVIYGSSLAVVKHSRIVIACLNCQEQNSKKLKGTIVFCFSPDWDHPPISIPRFRKLRPRGERERGRFVRRPTHLHMPFSSSRHSSVID